MFSPLSQVLHVHLRSLCAAAAATSAAGLSRRLESMLPHLVQTWPWEEDGNGVRKVWGKGCGWIGYMTRTALNEFDRPGWSSPDVLTTWTEGISQLEHEVRSHNQIFCPSPRWSRYAKQLENVGVLVINHKWLQDFGLAIGRQRKRRYFLQGNEGDYKQIIEPVTSKLLPLCHQNNSWVDLVREKKFHAPAKRLFPFHQSECHLVVCVPEERIESLSKDDGNSNDDVGKQWSDWLNDEN